MNKRIFVEKKNRFQTEAEDLLNQLRNNLGLNVKSCRVINLYDVFDINEDILNKALKTIFSEPMVDEILEALPEADYVLGKEYLPGQYDQRADSARQCVCLLNPETKCTIRSGQVFLIDGDLTYYIEGKAYILKPWDILFVNKKDKLT